MRTLLILTMVCLCCTVPALAAPAAPTAQGGLSVEETVRRALAYSPQLQQAQEVRNQARHEVRSAEAGYYPTIGIWGGAGVSTTDDNTTRQTHESNKTSGTGNTGLTLSQSIWQGGGTMALVKSRNAVLEAQTHMVVDSATMLVFNAVTSHMDVIRRRAIVGMAEENVRQHQGILKLLNSRFAQGIASTGEVEQVRSRLARAEAILVTHRQGLVAALANYQRLTGQSAPRDLQEAPLPRLVYDKLDVARDDSVAHNPRVLAELAKIRGAISDVDYAKSFFSPRLSFDAGPSYADWDRKGTNYQWTWNAMFNVRWDIYNGGANLADFKAASAKARQNRKALHVYMDLLDEELSTTFNRAYETREQSFMYAKSKKASRIARENFYQQFQAGQRGLLDVLDAETEFFYSSVEERVSASDSIISFYRLLALTGRLLDNLDIPMAALEPTAEPAENPWTFWRAEPVPAADEAAPGSTLRIRGTR